MASASKGKAIARTTIAIGEISLTGQIRPVPRMANRLREAARLGFTTALVPVHRKGSSWQQVEGMKLVEVATVKEALAALGI